MPQVVYAWGPYGVRTHTMKRTCARSRISNHIDSNTCLLENVVLNVFGISKNRFRAWCFCKFTCFGAPKIPLVHRQPVHSSMRRRSIFATCNAFAQKTCFYTFGISKNRFGAWCLCKLTCFCAPEVPFVHRQPVHSSMHRRSIFANCHALAPKTMLFTPF